MFGRFALALVASASMLPLAMPAAAQDGAVEEEIVVTAQKREELLREIPQSVTAVTSDTLERLQADSFQDYVGRIPGMVAGEDQPGRARLTLRGLNNEGIGASVATYVDETPYGSSSGLANGSVLAADIDPFDLERVEVLRGPQGTLYGANALGGLIKYVTRDPSSEGFELRTRATAEATEGGENSYALRAAINVPLGDQAGLRLSGLTRSTGGFIDQVVDADIDGVADPGEQVLEDANGTETDGLRASFILRATDDLTFRLSAVAQDIASENFNTVEYTVEGPSSSLRPGEPLYGDLMTEAPPVPVSSDVAYRIYNGTADWDLGWASLTSSTSFSQLDQFYIQVGQGLIIEQDVLHDKVTQEIRLTSPSSDRLEWMLGFFYTEEDALINQEIDLGILFDDATAAMLAGALGLTVDEFFEQARIGAAIHSDYTETALFGNATYYFSPQFDVNVGVRHAENEQEVAQVIDSTVVSDFVGIVLPEGSTPSDEGVTTYSISPRWRPSDDTMVYARIASGYRPGGPNIFFGGSIESTFESDTLVNYEVGVKTDLIDNLLRLDAAVFYIDWDNVQILVSEDIGTGDPINGNANGNTARSQGVEWAATLTPLDGLSVLWTGAYTDAVLTADGPALSTIEMNNGDRLPYVPEWATAIDIDYEWTAFGDNTAYVGGGARYVGEQHSTFPNVGEGIDQLEIDSFTVVDFRTGLRIDNISLELFARNLTDERGPIRMGTTVDPTAAATVLRPRTVGLTLTAEF